MYSREYEGKHIVKFNYPFCIFCGAKLTEQKGSVLETLKVGDKLTLQRENNKFDSNAIKIFTEDKKRIGYVSEKDNIVFARLMDAGKLLVAYINKIDVKGTFYQISIGIHLVDF